MVNYENDQGRHVECNERSPEHVQKASSQNSGDISLVALVRYDGSMGLNSWWRIYERSE
jgi:hypothetical protein